MTLVDRLGQVLPGSGDRQFVLLCLDLIDADGCDPGALANPGWRAVGIDIFLFKLVDALWSIGLQHAGVLEQQKARRRQTPDDIGLGVLTFGQQLRGHDARGVAHPFDLDVRVLGFKSLGKPGQLFRLDRCINDKLLGRLGRAADYRTGEQRAKDSQSDTSP